jgi:hypothetical protein
VHRKSRACAQSPFPRLRGKVGMGIRSRAHAHEAPSPVHGGRLGWGRSAVAPNTVPRHRPTPPTQPPPARAEGGVVSASEIAHTRTQPLPPFTGEGWDGGVPAVAPHTVPRYRPTPPASDCRAARSVECIGSRAHAHKAPSPACGGRLGWASEVARTRTKPLPPFTGEGWDGGTRRLHPTPCLATARRPPPNFPPLARREEW